MMEAEVNAASTTSSSSNKARIIYLNVGGVRYTTTSVTLCGSGENYFTGLLSGRFPELLDETGAYFIDRNGEYFAPILDYLRGGELEIPKQLSKRSLLNEARFYLIDGLIKSLAAEELQEQEVGDQTSSVRLDGYYEDPMNQSAISFLANGQVIFSKGDNYINNIVVFRSVTNMPMLWKNTEMGRKYATFVERSIRRGKFWTEGCQLKLMLTQVEDESVLGVVTNAGNVVYVSFEPSNFIKHAFVSWL